MPSKYRPSTRPVVPEKGYLEKLMERMGLGGSTPEPPTAPIPAPKVDTPPVKQAAMLPSTDMGMGNPAVQNYFRHAAATAARVGGPWLGTTLGATVGTAAAPGPGTVAGGIAGGASGGALGETVAQMIEPGDHPLNYKRIGVSGLLGGIPMGGSARVLPSIVKGAGMGYAGTAGFKMADGESAARALDPTTWSKSELLLGPGLGGTIGGGLAKLTAPKVVDPLEEILSRATAHPPSGGVSDVGRGVIPVSPTTPRVVKRGGTMSWDDKGGAVDPTPGRVIEAQRNVAAHDIPSDRGISGLPTLKGLEDNIKSTREISKAERGLNETSRKAENKLLTKEAAADLANTRDTMGGTTLSKIKVAEAKGATVAEKLKMAEATQEAKNLNARDKAVDKMAAQEARNLNTRDKYMAESVEQEAAQRRIDDFMAREDVVPSEQSVSETVRGKSPEGDLNLRQSFRVKPPEVSEGGGAAPSTPIPPRNTPPQGGWTREAVSNHTFSSKEEALEAGAATGAGTPHRVGRGKYLYKYKDEGAIAPPLELDDLGNPLDPPPAPTSPTLSPKTPNGGGAPLISRDLIEGKRYKSKVEASAIAKASGGTLHQDGPRGAWSVRFTPEEVPAVQAPDVAPVDVAHAPFKPSAPLPKEPIEAVSGPAKGDLTPEEFRRYMDIRPSQGVRRTPAELAEYRELHNRIYTGKGEVAKTLSPTARRNQLEGMPESNPDHPGHEAWSKLHDAADEAATIVENAAFQAKLKRLADKRAETAPHVNPLGEVEPTLPGVAPTINPDAKPIAEAPLSLSAPPAEVKVAPEPTLPGLAPKAPGFGSRKTPGTKSVKIAESSSPMMDSLMNDLHGEEGALPNINPAGPGTGKLSLPGHPADSPPAAGGAIPARLFKSPLEAAGENYGAIKAAKAAGENVPEEGRAAAGRAASRLKAQMGDRGAAPIAEAPPGFFKKAAQQIAERKATAATLGAKGEALELTHPSGRGALAGKDMSKPGGYRLTRFDENGAPTGHTEYKTLEEAISSGMEDGYTPVEPPPLRGGGVKPAPKDPESALPSREDAVANVQKWAKEKVDSLPPDQLSESQARIAASKAKKAEGPSFDDIAKLSPEEQTKTLTDLVNKFKGEKGQISPEMLARLGLGVGGAVAGSVMSDDPLTGALMGAGAGFFGPSVARALIARAQTTQLSTGTLESVAKNVKDKADTFFHMIPDYQRFALLADHRNLPLNAWVGPWGSSIMAAVEHSLMGDAKGRAALKLFLNPKNFPKEWFASRLEASKAIAHAEERTEGLLGQAGPKWFRDVTKQPGEAMTAGDIAARRLLERAGFTNAEARAITLTSEPYSALGRGISALKKAAQTEGGKKSWIMNMMLPFYKTATNQLEQNMERAPFFIGALYQHIAKDVPAPMQQILVQQGISLGVGGLSYVLGTLTPEANARFTNKFISNFGGQYGLIASAGFMAGQAQKKSTSKLGAFQRVATESIPMMSLDVINNTINNARHFAEGDRDLKMPFKLIPAAVDPNLEGSLTDRLLGTATPTPTRTTRSIPASRFRPPRPVRTPRP